MRRSARMTPTVTDETISRDLVADLLQYVRAARPEDDAISPELALVSPELRARAIAALPPVLVDSSFPAPTPYRRARAVRGLVWRFTEVGIVAAGTAFALILALTLIADALR
jgi:hypothetical protein